MSAAADLLGVTEETFKMIKATVQNGWLTGLGVQGVDLGDLISLVPVVTPFRNATPRVKPPQGANVAYWRALLDVTNAQPNPAVGNDFAGGLVEFEEQDVFAPFVPLRLTGRVTQDAIDIAEGYENALAVATMQTVNQLMIGEDKHGLMGQAYALPAIATPGLTVSATGGSIGTAAVNVKVAARSGINYYYGGSGIASAQASVTPTAGTTNSVTATVAAVKGAVAYDWYVAGFYYTTTTVNTVVITSIPTANQPLPSLPDLSATAPTAVPTADTSFSANYFNGLIASVLGDFGPTSMVTPGTGTNSGSYYASLDGAALAVNGAAIAQVDAMNLAIWNKAKLSPTRYLMNATQSQEIANDILGSTAATTFLQPQDIESRQNVVAGGALGWYLNKAVGGAAIRVEVHPNVPPGTLIAVTDKIPYPGANIDAPMRFRVQRDYSQFAYGANFVAGTLGGGPRQDFDVTVRETFELKAPLTCGVLSNVG